MGGIKKHNSNKELEMKFMHMHVYMHIYVYISNSCFYRLIELLGLRGSVGVVVVAGCNCNHNELHIKYLSVAKKHTTKQ